MVLQTVSPKIRVHHAHSYSFRIHQKSHKMIGSN